MLSKETDMVGGADAKALFSGWLVTGETYPARRDLARCGGVYDRERSGYVLPLSASDQITRLKEAWKLVAEIVDDLARDPAKPLDMEERRERRADRMRRKADRLEGQAANRARDAAEARAKHRPYTSDYTFLTQPILVGHHSQRRHERLWDRIDAARDAEMRNSIEATELEKRAERLRNAADHMPRKGDAEARHDARRAAAEALGIRVGSHIRCHVYGEGRVTRENAKSYTVRWARGFVGNIDKGWAELVRHDDTPLPGPAFAKGDRVMARVFLGHTRARPATVLRRTPRGYSVQIDGEGEPRTLAEENLSPMPAPAEGDV